MEKLQQTPQKYKGLKETTSNYMPLKWTNSYKVTNFQDEQRRNRNMNRTIISTEIEAVIKNLTINKSPGPDGLTSQFYQAFREKLTPILLQFFPKNCRGNNTPKFIL